MKQRIVLIAAVVVGILAAFATRGYLAAKDREVESEKARFRSKYRTVEVVVAGRPIPAGSVLSLTDIGHVAVVEQQLRHDAIRWIITDYVVTDSHLERGMKNTMYRINGIHLQALIVQGIVKQKYI